MTLKTKFPKREGGLIDLFTTLGGSKLDRYEWFCDGQSCDQCHPDDNGYAHMAKVVYEGMGL